MIKLLLRTAILEQCIDAFAVNVVNNFIKPKLPSNHKMPHSEIHEALMDIFPELFSGRMAGRQCGKTNLGLYYALRFLHDKRDNETFDL